ncbi:MAG: hypothetical protein AABY34_05920 [Pseudomonadota bacterium]
MYFVAILIGLSIERWTSLASQLRSYALLEKYIEVMTSWLKTRSWPVWVGLLILLLPITLAVAFFYVVFTSAFSGLLGLVFAVFVLFYCLGSFPSAAHSEGVENIVVQAHRNIFSVLFWFMVCGPAGAVLYRVNSLLVPNYSLAELFQLILEWVPARLEAVSYAIVSHFKSVMACVMKYLFSGLNDNEQLLIESAAASIDANVDHVIHDTLKLIDRSLLAWLTLIVIIVLF